ncbi:ATP-binding protein [Paludibaculum fermentans]|uniref:ATP-binding protein n=1 Tax=Paludibaculum fermentans TaxID=1473598 RepID=UPI003EC040E3
MPTRLSILGVPLSETVLRPRTVVPLAAVLVAILVLFEWRSKLDVSLGIFYVFPIAVAATALSRWQILAVAAACAFLRGLFTPQYSGLEFGLRYTMALLAYSGMGLLIFEMSRNRRIVIAHYARLKLEQELRRRAEEQLRILAESSPAAILTLDHDGKVIAANRASHDIFGITPPDTLMDRDIGGLVPTLGSAVKLHAGQRQVRTSAWTWAKRADGTMFPIATWFSTYGDGPDHHLAAIVVDVSEEVRDREMENFRHVLSYNRLLAGAVSHEIRNLCSAASMVASNLGRRPEVAVDADFQALNQLVGGLTKLASFELAKNTTARSASLAAVLDNLRVVVETDWREIDGQFEWLLPANLPDVQADSHGLLQIFLNLAQNSLRAVDGGAVRTLRVEVEVGGDSVRIAFIDSGPGVSQPETLFHPFRSNSDGSGLGLYISRALARSFSGDLVHVPRSSGCRFDLTLKPVRRLHDGGVPPLTAGASDSLVHRG